MNIANETKEFDVLVIGSGPGGYTAAKRAAEAVFASPSRNGKDRGRVHQRRVHPVQGSDLRSPSL